MISTKTIEVRYNETDQMGVVYHSNYLIWLDMSRTKFFKDLGFNYAEIEKQGIIFPVREVNIQYYSSCRYGEEITVETKVKKFTNIKTIYEHILKNNEGELKAKADSTVVCVDKNTFKIAKTERVLPEVFETYSKLNK